MAEKETLEGASAPEVEAPDCRCGHALALHKHADRAGRPCQHPDKNCLCGVYRPVRPLTQPEYNQAFIRDIGEPS